MHNSHGESDRLRIGRRYLVNHYYHLTTATENRNPVFEDFWAARTLIHRLRHESEHNTVDSVAYVVMPDHFHWLVQSKDGRIDTLMQRIKAHSSRLIPGLKWQRGYYDRCLRKEEDLRLVARYIIANPLRAELVSKVRDYPHWDACFL